MISSSSNVFTVMMTKEKSFAPQWDEGILRGTTQIPHRQKTADALLAGNGAEPFPSTERFQRKSSEANDPRFSWTAFSICHPL